MWRESAGGGGVGGGAARRGAVGVAGPQGWPTDPGKGEVGGGWVRGACCLRFLDGRSHVPPCDELCPSDDARGRLRPRFGRSSDEPVLDGREGGREGVGLCGLCDCRDCAIVGSEGSVGDWMEGMG